MNKQTAQQIIDSCDKYIVICTPRKFRNEMNISWLINDVVKQFK